MANITVTRTGTVPTVTLDTPNPATLINGDVFTETGYVLDVTNPTYDLFADGYNADVVARDTALQTALDAGEVTVDVNGTAITTGAKLAELGTGNTVADQDNQTLAEVLTEGNTTGTNDIIVATPQKIEFGVGSGVSMAQDGSDEILEIQTKYGATINATEAIGVVDLGGNYVAAVDLGGSGNSIQMDATGLTQITMNQNFGAGVLILRPTNITGSKTQTLQDVSGTIALTSDIPSLSGYQLTSEKNAANGYAGLDASSKINPSQLPAIAITDTFVVASQAAMLALVAQTGDIAVRTDVEQTFILQGTDPSVLGDWVQLQTPTDAVSSVFSRTGVVVAQNGDYTAAQVTNAFDKTADDTDDITEGATNKFATAAEKTKLGFISVTQAVDLDTMESDITANNAKVTNATHTGDVTGATALTIANDAVTYAKMQNVSAASRLLGRGSAAGAGNTEEITLGVGLAMTGTVLSATGTGLATKAGVVAPGTFTGMPRSAAVVFSTAFADANYSVSVIGEDSRSWTIQTQTAAGFTISTNAAAPLSNNVYWTAVKHGETA